MRFVEWAMLQRRAVRESWGCLKSVAEVGVAALSELGLPAAMEAVVTESEVNFVPR